MKTQINIVSANPGTSGVEVVFARQGSQVLESAIVSGEVFSNVLKAANLPNIPASYRNINGATALVEVVDAKQGESFTNRDGSTGTYSRDHIRLNNLSIINGAVIYAKLSIDEVNKDNMLFAAQAVTFTPKANSIGRSLIPAKPVVIDNAVEESAPEVVTEPTATKKASQKVLETAEQ